MSPQRVARLQLQFEKGLCVMGTPMAWLETASRGQCGETVDDDVGDCTSGFKGNLGLPMRKAAMWEMAVRECMDRCSACARCNYISVSTKWHDCSWYFGPCCLSQKVPGFRSGRVSNASLPVVGVRSGRRRRNRGGEVPSTTAEFTPSPATAATPLRCRADASFAERAIRTNTDGQQSASVALVVLVGVLSVPTSFERRAWIRHHTRAMVSSPGAHLQFVFGVGCPLNRGEADFFAMEKRRHPEDMYTLNTTSDCVTPFIFHKTLAWYESAVRTHPGYAWYGKSDDDSLIHLPRLRVDLLAALARAAACGREQPYAYYGPMRWRLWQPEGFGGCGTFEETGPPHPPAASLYRDADACGAGPFPYADGSLHVLSVALTRAVVGSVPARAVGRALPSLCGKESVARPPKGALTGRPLARGFLEEDVGTGYLVAATAALHRLAVVYFPIIKWRHNRFWVTLRDEHTLPDEHVVVAHKVKDAITAELTARAFQRGELQPSADAFECVDCRSGWGWRVSRTPWGEPPIELFGCCARAETAGDGNSSRPRATQLVEGHRLQGRGNVPSMSVGSWG